MAGVSSLLKQPKAKVAAGGMRGQAKIIFKHCQLVIGPAVTGVERIPNEDTGEIDEVRLPDGGMETPVLVLTPEEDNMLEVYALMMGMSGPGGEFEGAEFLVKMTLKKETEKGGGYPFEPPDFTFKTENGIFILGAGTPCISIGKYHATQMEGGGKAAYGYNAGLKLSGFLNAIWGIFSDPKSLGGGVNVMGHTGPAEWREAARASRAYNEKHYAKLMERFDAVYNLKARRAYWQGKWLKK